MSKAQIPPADIIAEARTELVERFGTDADTAAEFVLALVQDAARKGTLTAADAGWLVAFGQYRADVRPDTGRPDFAVRMHPSAWRTLLNTFDRGAVNIRQQVDRQIKAEKMQMSAGAVWLANIGAARRNVTEAFVATLKTRPEWSRWAPDDVVAELEKAAKDTSSTSEGAE